MLAIFYLFVLCLCTPVPADTELKAVTNILGQISAPPSTSTLTERHTIEPLYKIDLVPNQVYLSTIKMRF